MKVCWSRLLALTFVLAVHHVADGQQNPHGRLPVTSFAQPYLFLIRDPLVHDDLGLNTQQREVIGALHDELDGPLWSMRNKSAQHIEKTLSDATAAAKTRLSSILTRGQLQRLEQIEMWTLGMKAFLREDLPDKLGLSEDQRTKIRETVTETQKAINDLKQQLQSRGSSESLEKQARELRTDEQKQIVATLTRRQQQQWLALLGKRIDESKLGRVKFKAPELHSEDGWINSAPLTLKQLKGKVVALYFYAFV